MNADAPDARVENDAADGTLERDAGKPAALPATPADDEAEGDSDSDETSEMTEMDEIVDPSKLVIIVRSCAFPHPLRFRELDEPPSASPEHGVKESRKHAVSSFWVRLV